MVTAGDDGPGRNLATGRHWQEDEIGLGGGNAAEVLAGEHPGLQAADGFIAAERESVVGHRNRKAARFRHHIDDGPIALDGKNGIERGPSGRGLLLRSDFWRAGYGCLRARLRRCSAAGDATGVDPLFQMRPNFRSRRQTHLRQHAWIERPAQTWAPVEIHSCCDAILKLAVPLKTGIAVQPPLEAAGVKDAATTRDTAPIGTDRWRRTPRCGSSRDSRVNRRRGTRWS